MKVALLAIILTGCLIKPDRVTGDGGGHMMDARAGDGGGSGSGSDSGEIRARILSTGFFDGAGGSTMHQGATTWELGTNDLQPGELVILIGNVDGNVTLMGLDPNFDLLVQQQFGPNAGQTYLAFARIAGGAEPATFSGSYGGGTTTGYAALALVAVRNAAGAIPVVGANHDGCVMSCNPGPNVKLNAPQISTVADGSLILFAGGADWQGGGHVAFQAPPDMTSLQQMTDDGTNTAYNFSKSTLLLATAIQPTAGMSAAYSGATTNLNTAAVGGLPWTTVIAVAPKP